MPVDSAWGETTITLYFQRYLIFTGNVVLCVPLKLITITVIFFIGRSVGDISLILFQMI